MLEPLNDHIWVAAQPLKFLGLHLGTRMTVVRLDDGGLFVHSPIVPDEAIRSALDELGPVRHIVAPNLYHHLFAGHLKRAYPNAKLWGVKGLAKKRKDLAFDAELADEPDPAWKGQLEQTRMRGSLLGETVFFHPTTRTLVSCDVTENFETSDHFVTRTYLKLAGIHGKPGVPRPLRPLIRDRRAARESVDRMLDWDPEAITLSHGRVVSTGGRRILEHTYLWLRS